MKVLADLVRSAVIDVEALRRPLRPCDLEQCRGTCCHDGVYLGGEESDVLRRLVAGERRALEMLGAVLPERVVVYGRFRGLVSGPKTATRPAPEREHQDGYPEHFARTDCVFLLPDSRCALQALALERGLDPWHFKPATCWIHPLSFDRDGAGRPRLTLHDESTDPHWFADYPGFSSRTPCGKTCPSGGRPAWEVLASELARLGEIGERDLLGEIRGG